MASMYSTKPRCGIYLLGGVEQILLRKGRLLLEGGFFISGFFAPQSRAMLHLT
jgi:hypothetical protein